MTFEPSAITAWISSFSSCFLQVIVPSFKKEKLVAFLIQIILSHL